MNALDYPVEALALNYLSYGFLTAVNSVWAWAAVITAAVSFWKIRALSLKIPVQEEIAENPASVISTPTAAKNLSPAPETPSCGGLERECNTRVKFTLYYGEDDDVSEGADGGESDVNGGVEAVCDDWERMMPVRMGDLGWYRCQDLTALDGSVVRLWDGRRRRRAGRGCLDSNVYCTW